MLLRVKGSRTTLIAACQCLTALPTLWSTCYAWLFVSVQTRQGFIGRLISCGTLILCVGSGITPTTCPRRCVSNQVAFIFFSFLQSLLALKNFFFWHDSCTLQKAKLSASCRLFLSFLLNSSHTADVRFDIRIVSLHYLTTADTFHVQVLQTADSVTTHLPLSELLWQISL